MSVLTQLYFDYDVFISYSHRDKERVRGLAERLDAGGLRVWFDEQDLSFGADISLAITKAVLSSRRIVACWSKAYLQSSYGQLEISTILSSDPMNENLRFLPVLLESCEIPESFRRFKYVDYREETEAAFLALLNACRKPTPETGLVRPLHVTEDRFLQLLLSHFSLHRWAGKSGVELRVGFNDDTDAIWNSQGKTYILSKLAEDERKAYQKELDEFLLVGQGVSNYEFPTRKVPEFVFRYASAGTLPIVTFDDEEPRQYYYCLFYRDVYPIGWNIANGGCDNRAELLNPEITMERELREELIVADFPNKTRYVFAGDATTSLEHPSHAVSLGLWRKEHPTLDLKSLTTKKVPIEWQKGPDSLCIKVGDSKEIECGGFYLNINGDDFGIEVDRVATIRLPRSVILFDGELEGSLLVKAPIGLFEVEKFNAKYKQRPLPYADQTSGQTDFRPDRFFFDAKPYEEGRQIDEVLKKHKEHVRQFRSTEEIKKFESSIETDTQYSLCPVTARIIHRHLQATGKL